MRYTLLRLTILLLSVLNFTGCGDSGPYRLEIGKLHSGMSRNEVVTALGNPEGRFFTDGEKSIYYKSGADTMLAVVFDEHGSCGWLLLQAPSTGPSKEFSYYKVIKASGGISAPYAFGMKLFDLRTYLRTLECGSTETTMWVIKRRILRFAQSHNKLPQSLSELPNMTGYDNSVSDQWGRAITYEVSSSGLVTLTSLGRDGKVDGSGKGGDIVATFPSHDTKGGWSDELVPWSHDPLAQ